MAKKVLLKITSCAGCPFFRYDEFANTTDCLQLNREVVVYGDEIAEDCPLEEWSRDTVKRGRDYGTQDDATGNA